MALGAFQAQPQEGVRHLQRAADPVRSAALPVQVERPPLAVQLQIRTAGGVALHHRLDLRGALFGATAVPAGGHQDALDELIVGHVFLQASADPRLEARGVGLLAKAIGIDAEVGGLEQIAELQRPQRGVAGPAQQFFDFPAPFVRGGIRQEGADLLRRRQFARHVQAGPAEEGGIVGERSRRQVHPLELGQDVRSMKLCGWMSKETRSPAAAPGRGPGPAGHGSGRSVPPRRAAGPTPAHSLHRRGRGIQRLKRTVERHVLGGAVGKPAPRRAADRIRPAGRLLRRDDAERLDVGRRRRIRRSTRGQPALKHLVLEGSRP